MTDLLEGLEGWDDPTEWHPIHELGVCRDCGRPKSFWQGGASQGVAFSLCDSCAAIDACRFRHHECEIGDFGNWINHDPIVIKCSCGWWETASHFDDEGNFVRWTPDELVDIVAEHEARGAREHVSHWGSVHDAADHDDLVEAQTKRRAAYLAKVAA